MSELTKEEFKTLLEIQAKNVEQLTTIANHLTTIVDTQNSIYDRLYNGMAKEISDNVITTVKECNKHCSEAHLKLENTIGAMPVVVDEKIKNSDISRDIKHTKWFIGAVGLIIIVASILVRVMDNREFYNSQTIKEIKKITENLDKLTIDNRVQK